MKKVFLFLVAMFWAVSSMSAQKMEKLKLYNDNDEAEMFVYLPDESKASMPAILICPGGAYAGLAIDNEGHNMAKWYSSKGLVAAVLKYRMPHGDYKIPLNDAEKGMEILKDNADRWNIDTKRIGVAGSSAGGHLAASLSTLGSDANRPAFTVLYYPVINFDDEIITHKGSKENLLGDAVNNQELIRRFSLQEQVDDKTPPALIMVSDDDSLVPTENSILYYLALHKNKIPAALYVFPNGEHGWGTTEGFLYKKEVKELIYLWLVHNNFVKE